MSAMSAKSNQWKTLWVLSAFSQIQTKTISNNNWPKIANNNNQSPKRIFTKSQ